MALLIIIAVLTFVAIALAVSFLLSPKEDIVRRRIMGDKLEQPQSEPAPGRGAFRRLLYPVLNALGAALAQVLPKNLVHRIDILIEQAGGRTSQASFLTFWFVTAVASMGFLVLLVATGTSGAFLLYGVMIGVFGVFAPYILLSRRASRRRRTIERSLPDALDLLLTSVEAGLGVDAAFALVTERSKGPVAEVFTDYMKQVGLGRSRRDALFDIGQRSGAPSLHRLAATVAQTWEVGASMGDVLRLQAAELRKERHLRAQEAAQRAPFLMTIPLALCFMPAMIAVVVVPSALSLVRFVGDLGE